MFLIVTLYNYFYFSCLYQVLSESVSRALSLIGGDEAEGIAIFVKMMDKFFDAMNIHNYVQGIHSCKEFPYTSAEDFHLKVST